MSESEPGTQLSGPYRWTINEDDSLLGDGADYSPPSSVSSVETPLDRSEDTDDRDEEAAIDAAIGDKGVFRNEIQRDAEICSSCFLKNYDVVLPHSWKAEVSKGLVRYFIPSDGTTESEYGAGEPCEHPPRACQCGRIGRARIRPLRKEVAIEFAWNLSETLTRKEIEHNPLLLAFYLAFRKSTPDGGRRDDSNFDEAAGRALESHHYSFADLLSVPNQRRRALPEPTEEDHLTHHRWKAPAVQRRASPES